MWIPLCPLQNFIAFLFHLNRFLLKKCINFLILKICSKWLKYFVLKSPFEIAGKLIVYSDTGRSLQDSNERKTRKKIKAKNSEGVSCANYALVLLEIGSFCKTFLLSTLLIFPEYARNSHCFFWKGNFLQFLVAYLSVTEVPIARWITW